MSSNVQNIKYDLILIVIDSSILRRAHHSKSFLICEAVIFWLDNIAQKPKILLLYFSFFQFGSRITLPLGNMINYTLRQCSTNHL